MYEYKSSKVEKALQVTNDKAFWNKDRGTRHCDPCVALLFASPVFLCDLDVEACTFNLVIHDSRYLSIS